jgi:hypothetical protein
MHNIKQCNKTHRNVQNNNEVYDFIFYLIRTKLKLTNISSIFLLLEDEGPNLSPINAPQYSCLDCKFRLSVVPLM